MTVTLEPPTCNPPGIHIYLSGARHCQCGRKKDGVTLAESDWLKALVEDPRAVKPEGDRNG